MPLLAQLRRLILLKKVSVPDGTKADSAACVNEKSEKSLPVSRKVVLEKGFIYRNDGYEGTPQDDHFNKVIEETLGEYFAFAYYTTIAGTKHSNADGSSRIRIIRTCTACEQLVLQREPENPYDPNAIAVFREDGSQLGYVPRRSAQEMTNGMRLRGEKWTALFRKPTRHPETGQVVGAVILLLLLKQ